MTSSLMAHKKPSLDVSLSQALQSHTLTPGHAHSELHAPRIMRAQLPCWLQQQNLTLWAVRLHSSPISLLSLQTTCHLLCANWTRPTFAHLPSSVSPSPHVVTQTYAVRDELSTYWTDHLKTRFASQVSKEYLPTQNGINTDREFLTLNLSTE